MKKLLYKIAIDTADAREQLKSAFAGIGGSDSGSSSVGGTHSAFSEFSSQLAESFSELKAEMDQSQTVEVLTMAFARFGKTAAGAVLKLIGPIGKFALVTVAAVKALDMLTSQMQKMERASHALRHSGRFGGRMQGTGTDNFIGWQTTARNLAVRGATDESDYLEAIAEAIRSAPSVDKSTMRRVDRMSYDVGAMLGIDPAEIFGEIVPILNDLSVTYEQLHAVGAEVTRQELNHLNALKSTGRQYEANRIILDKIEGASKGAGEQLDDSLFGNFQKFFNMLQNIFKDLGRVVAPLLNPLLKAVNLLVWAISSLTDAFASLWETIFKGLNGIFKYLTGVDFGFDTTTREKGKPAESWTDPRLQVSAQFETAGSMFQRMQISAVNKNSPAVRQVNLLEEINRKIEGIHSTSRKGVEAMDGVRAEQKETARSIGKMNGGLR